MARSTLRPPYKGSVKGQRPRRLSISFQALGDDEQEAALTRLQEIRLVRLAGDESAGARMITSLARAAAHLGRAPSPDDYT